MKNRKSPTSPHKIEKEKFNFDTTLPVSILFFIVAFIGLLHHEMWRDELQPWLVARDAHSLKDFFQNVAYEGHPFLWYFLLFPVSAVSEDPFAMQIFHLLIATAYVFLFNKYSPFSWLNKILFSFGYFTLYEYGIFSSCYGLGFLLVIALCSLYKNRVRNFYFIVGSLVLLANTSPYGLVMSVGFFILLFFDFIFYRNEWKGLAFGKIAFSLLFYTAGLFLALYYITPHKDVSGSYPLYVQIFNPDYVMLVFSKIYNAYLLFPELDIVSKSWSTTGLENFQEDVTTRLSGHLAIAFALLFIFICTLVRKPAALLFYLAATAGLLLMLCVSPRLSCRYIGHLFIIAISALWVSDYFKEAKIVPAYLSFYPKFMKALSPINKLGVKYLLFIILLSHVFVGLNAYTNDYKNVFSASKDAGNYIVDQELDSLPIIGAIDYALAPVAAYTYGQIYYPQRKEYGSFVIWDGHRKLTSEWGEIVQAVDTILDAKHDKALLVLNFQPQYTAQDQVVKLTQGMLNEKIKINLLKAFENAIIGDEKYYIYLVEKK